MESIGKANTAAEAANGERDGGEDHMMNGDERHGGEGDEEEEEKTASKGDQAGGPGHQNANGETSRGKETAEEMARNERNDVQMTEDGTGKDSAETSEEERRFNLALEKEKVKTETFEMEEGMTGMFTVTGVADQCFTSGAMTKFLKSAGLTFTVLKGTSGVNPTNGRMTFKIILKTDGTQYEDLSKESYLNFNRKIGNAEVPTEMKTIVFEWANFQGMATSRIARIVPSKEKPKEFQQKDELEKLKTQIVDMLKENHGEWIKEEHLELVQSGSMINVLGIKGTKNVFLPMIQLVAHLLKYREGSIEVFDEDHSEAATLAMIKYQDANKDDKMAYFLNGLAKTKAVEQISEEMAEKVSNVCADAGLTFSSISVSIRVNAGSGGMGFVDIKGMSKDDQRSLRMEMTARAGEMDGMKLAPKREEGGEGKKKTMVCFAFEKTGVCKNQNCPFTHEGKEEGKRNESELSQEQKQLEVVMTQVKELKAKGEETAMVVAREGKEAKREREINVVRNQENREKFERLNKMLENIHKAIKSITERAEVIEADGKKEVEEIRKSIVTEHERKDETEKALKQVEGGIIKELLEKKVREHNENINEKKKSIGTWEKTVDNAQKVRDEVSKAADEFKIHMGIENDAGESPTKKGKISGTPGGGISSGIGILSIQDDARDATTRSLTDRFETINGGKIGGNGGGGGGGGSGGRGGGGGGGGGRGAGGGGSKSGAGGASKQIRNPEQVTLGGGGGLKKGADGAGNDSGETSNAQRDLTPGQVASEVRRIEHACEEVGGGGAEGSEEEEEDDSDEDGIMAKPGFTNFSATGWRTSLGEAKEKVLLAAESLKKAISPKIKKTRDGNGEEGKGARTSSKIGSKTPTATSNKCGGVTEKTESGKTGGEGDAVLVDAGEDKGGEKSDDSEYDGRAADSWRDDDDSDSDYEAPAAGAAVEVEAEAEAEEADAAEKVEAAAVQAAAESDDENINDGNEGGVGEGDEDGGESGSKGADDKKGGGDNDAAGKSEEPEKAMAEKAGGTKSDGNGDDGGDGDGNDGEGENGNGNEGGGEDGGEPDISGGGGGGADGGNGTRISKRVKRPTAKCQK